MHAAQREMIEAGGRTAQSFGLNRIFGQMYILLYLSEEAQSLDQLAEALGVSKASVSIAARQLESWGAVRRSWRKGDRRDYYEAQTDLKQLLRSGLMVSLNKKLDSARHQIQRSLDLLGEPSSADHQFLRKRLLEADQRREKLEKLINHPLLGRLL